MEGEAGIGTTTLWLAALEQAREQGFRTLSARAWEAESVLAYGSVADLLGDVGAKEVRCPVYRTSSTLPLTEFCCARAQVAPRPVNGSTGER